MHLSLIIPTLNRAQLLEKTLLSISRNKVDFKKFEVLVIDNGSTDDTNSVVEKFNEYFPNINLRYYFESEPGLLAARHRGLFESKSDYLTFIDDDVELNNLFVKTIIDNFINYPGIGMFTGPCFPNFDCYPPNWILNFWEKCKFGKSLSALSLLDFGDKIKEIDPLYVWGLNFSIRKNLIFSLGGFHPDCMPFELQFYQGSGETAISLSAKNSGIRAIYDPGLLLHHFVPAERMTVNYFEKRAYFQGISESFYFNRYNIKVSINISQYCIKLILNLKNLIFNRHFYLLYKRFENKKLESSLIHTQKFNSENKYKLWVLKNDYFDYKIEKYL